MLRLSKKADYALIAMRHLAASEPGSSSSAREIAESYAIPRNCSPRCCSGWSGRGCSSRCRAPAAATSWAGRRVQMSVADVIQAIDGPVAVTACSPTNHTCEQFEHCEIRDPLWKIKTRIVDALATVSLAELAEPVVPETVPVPLTVASRSRAARAGE